MWDRWLYKTMTKASLTAQHFLQCEDCKENPATFVWKVCKGNLCELCRINHVKKNVTQNREILPLTSTNEEMLDLLMCEIHKKNLGCYCKRCRELVSSQCTLHSYNQHFLISKFTMYNEIYDNYKWHKKKANVLFHQSTMCTLLKKKKKVSVS